MTPTPEQLAQLRSLLEARCAAEEEFQKYASEMQPETRPDFAALRATNMELRKFIFANFPGHSIQHRGLYYHVSESGELMYFDHVRPVIIADNPPGRRLWAVFCEEDEDEPDFLGYVDAESFDEAEHLAIEKFGDDYPIDSLTVAQKEE